MRLIGRLFGKPARAAAATPATSVAPAAMHWRYGASMPIPDWPAMAALAPQTDDFDTSEAYWNAVARGWLDELARHLGAQYRVSAFEHFLILSPQRQVGATLTLETCERTRRRILAALPGIASNEGFGAYLVLVFADIRTYDAYLDNYDDSPDADPLRPRCMFLHDGYAHCVLTQDGIDMLEPVLAHELTRSLIAHLPLPAWLREGIAVGIRNRLAPRRVSAATAAIDARDLEKRHAAFWNEDTIQEFWNGAAFFRADDGNPLSYDLGERLTRVLAADYAAFVRFANAASREDSGVAAAREHLGLELDAPVAAILGPGAWRPEPKRWRDGIDAAPFRDVAPASTHDASGLD